MTKKKAQKPLPTSKARTAYALLSDVCDLIAAEPRRYNQTWWLSRKGKEEDNIDEPPRGYPSCGTVGCVAGWVVSLKRKHVPANVYAIEDIAADILGIDPATAMDFFDASAVEGKPQTAAHVKNGIKHIRQFQETHAAQLKAKRV